MSGKTRGRAAHEDDEEGFLPPTQEELDQADFMALGQEGAKLMVWRLHKDGVRGFCRTVGYESVTPDLLTWLQAEFGGGKFHCLLKSKSGPYLGSRTLTIDGAPIENGPKAAGGGTDQLLQMYRDQSASMQNLLAAIIAGNRGPDIGAMMTGMAAMMGALRPTAPPVDIASVLASLTTTWKTLQPTAPQGDDIERLKGILQISKEIGGGSGEPPDLLTSALQALPSIIGLRHNAPAAQGNGAPGPRVIPAHTEASGAVPAAPVEVPMDPRVAKVQGLIEKARRGADPELYADLLLDEAETDEGSNFLVSACMQYTWGQVSDALKNFGVTEPPVIAWFQQLFDSIRAAAAEAAPDPAAAPAPAAGNKGA